MKYHTQAILVEQILQLNNRLYCAWNALLQDDPINVDHNEKIGFVLAQIWEELDQVLSQTHQWDRHEQRRLEEELDDL